MNSVKNNEYSSLFGERCEKVPRIEYYKVEKEEEGEKVDQLSPT